MNRINPIMNCEVENFDPNDVGSIYGELTERFDYKDMLRVLPKENYGVYPLTEVRMDTRCQMKSSFYSMDDNYVPVYLRFVGDGEIRCYCEVGDKWLEVMFDDHNWNVKDENSIFFDIMDRVKEVYDKYYC